MMLLVEHDNLSKPETFLYPQFGPTLMVSPLYRQN